MGGLQRITGGLDLVNVDRRTAWVPFRLVRYG